MNKLIDIKQNFMCVCVFVVFAFNIFEIHIYMQLLEIKRMRGGGIAFGGGVIRIILW